MGSRRAAQLRRIQDQITAAMKRNLDPTGKGKGQGAQIFKEYQDAAEYWPIWKSFQDAARRAKDNMSFSPGQLAKTSAKSPQNLIYANKGPGQRAGELGVEVLENFPSRQGLFQTLAATGPVVGGGAAAGGAAGGALAFLATMGIGRAMVSKPLQKFLSGQTRRQQLNRTMRRRYISELQKLGLSRDAAEMVLNMPGRAGRQAVAKTGVDYAS